MTELTRTQLLTYLKSDQRVPLRELTMENAIYLMDFIQDNYLRLINIERLWLSMVVRDPDPKFRKLASEMDNMIGKQVKVRRLMEQLEDLSEKVGASWIEDELKRIIEEMGNE